MLERTLAWLRDAPWWEAGLALLLLNIAVLVVVAAGGAVLVARFPQRHVAPPPGPFSRSERWHVAVTVLLNTAVTLAGLALWRADLVRIRMGASWAAVLLDAVVLLLVMDLSLYVLHRLAHAPWIFRLVHAFHHRHEDIRPLTFFVLSPGETLSIGALWLAVLMLHDATWGGMTLYLAINCACGTVGHLGVEPLPQAWARAPLLRHVAGGSFHVQHHQDPERHFGFYTLIWDRLFGTIRPGYEEDFGHIPPWVTGDAARTRRATR